MNDKAICRIEKFLSYLYCWYGFWIIQKKIFGEKFTLTFVARFARYFLCINWCSDAFQYRLFHWRTIKHDGFDHFLLSCIHFHISIINFSFLYFLFHFMNDLIKKYIGAPLFRYYYIIISIQQVQEVLKVHQVIVVSQDLQDVMVVE